MKPPLSISHFQSCSDEVTFQPSVSRSGMEAPPLVTGGQTSSQDLPRTVPIRSACRMPLSTLLAVVIVAMICTLCMYEIRRGQEEYLAAKEDPMVLLDLLNQSSQHPLNQSQSRKLLGLSMGSTSPFSSSPSTTPSPTSSSTPSSTPSSSTPSSAPSSIPPTFAAPTAPTENETSPTPSSQLPIPMDLMTNCTTPAIEQFPGTIMAKKYRIQGGLVAHFAISLYAFAGLSMTCEHFFVPALRVLTERLNLEPDIAGATFMSAGAATPSLAAAIIGVFIAEDDIGVGCVVGGAMFNVAFVIGACGLFAGRVVKLQKWSLLRDSLFYLISVLMLAYAMSDQMIEWYEATAFISLYAAYCIVMALNQTLEDQFTLIKAKLFRSGEPNERTHLISSKKYSKDLLVQEYKIFRHSNPDITGGADTVPDLESGRFKQQSIHGAHMNRQDSGMPSSCSTSLTVSEEEDFSPKPKSSTFRKVCCNILMIPLWPLKFALSLTIPECANDECSKRFWPLTFLMSILWISIFSYILVWMVTIIGFDFHIPDSVMGLTFLAAAVGVPDLISSVLVVRDGFGDMGMSNALASNVFDILMCLGLPWFLKTTIIEPGSYIPVASSGLSYSSILLVCTVLILVIATHVNGWKLNAKLGIILMCWYLIAITLATLNELNIFYDVNPPICKSHF